MGRTALDVLTSPGYMLDVLHKVHAYVRSQLRALPERSFDPYWFHTVGHAKQLVAIDLLAERVFMKTLATRFGRHAIRVLGEESLHGDPDLSEERRVCVFTDTIDGTDLLQRRLSNWCSAVTIFDPNARKIRAAYVATPSDGFYSAIGDGSPHKTPLRRHRRGQANPGRLLAGPNRSKSLRDAVVCSNAQTSSRLLALLQLHAQQPFVAWLRQNLEVDARRRELHQRAVGFRFYNLAGNPMMVRLADGTVDAVVELHGQLPHDVVPGAFIALRAGARLSNLQGQPISEDDLAAALLRPANRRSRLRYILAANPQVMQDLVSLLARTAPPDRTPVR